MEKLKHLVVIRGPIGAGKTTLARAICEQQLNCSMVEIDAIKRMIDPQRKYADRRDVALQTAVHLASTLLGSGKSVVAETPARWPDQTLAFRRLAADTPKTIFSSFLVTAPYSVCARRARERVVPDISYPIDDEMLDEYYTNLTPLEFDEATFDSSRLPVSSLVHSIRRRMYDKQREAMMEPAAL